MRVAIVHDWLTGMRGGEKVLSLICRMLPEADLLTLLHVPGSCDRHIEAMRIRTSFLDDLPGVRRYYRHLLPAMPLAIERMDASAYDLIISCSHCVAKGVVRSPHAAHLCYCFTPMRYAWDCADTYSQQMGGAAGLALRAMRPYLRAWDLRSAAHVDMFPANSLTVARRIAHRYGRQARVAYSPIDTSYFTPSGTGGTPTIPREDFYLIVSALSPYKRLDQAIAATAALGRRLKVIGTGPERDKLRQMAGANVEFLGWCSDEQVRDHYRRCRAVLMPGEEDFGLVPLEAMACGAPAIAYAAGGATETILSADDAAVTNPTGLLYTPGTTAGLTDALRRFETLMPRLCQADMVAWSARFGAGQFVATIADSIRQALAAKGLPMVELRLET